MVKENSIKRTKNSIHFCIQNSEMAESFHDEIRFQTHRLYNAQDVAAYGFKLHRSVEFLDLSSNDCIATSSVKYILTKEDMRKRVQPDRQILYKYHLDLPTDLEECSCEEKICDTPIFYAFHLRKIDVSDWVFNVGLEKDICLAIENAGSKRIEKLRSYMKIISLLKFRTPIASVFYLYDSVLQILYDANCADSTLVTRFVTMLNFNDWVYHFMSTENPCLLEYVLIQVQKARSIERLWVNPYAEMDPASQCFFSDKIQNFFVLIKYGTVPSIPFIFYFLESTTEDLFDRAVDEGLFSFSRVFRIFQVFYVYEDNKEFLLALRYIWRSIKEPFLSRTEMISTLTLEFSQDKATDLIQYYVNFVVGEGNCSLKPSPRPLMDLCRVEIRRLLSDNYRLPSGVSCLDIPKILKSYLLLER